MAICRRSLSNDDRFVKLEPLLELEYPEDDKRRHHHKSKCERVPKQPLKFGHELEIHTINARDQRWRHEYYRYNGKYPNHFILLDVHQTYESILQILQS